LAALSARQLVTANSLYLLRYYECIREALVEFSTNRWTRFCLADKSAGARRRRQAVALQNARIYD
jgi:hypothetical protein